QARVLPTAGSKSGALIPRRRVGSAGGGIAGPERIGYRRPSRRRLVESAGFEAVVDNRERNLRGSWQHAKHRATCDRQRQKCEPPHLPPPSAMIDGGCKMDFRNCAKKLPSRDRSCEVRLS